MKYATIPFRLSYEQKESIIKLALDSDKSVSAYIRSILFRPVINLSKLKPPKQTYYKSDPIVLQKPIKRPIDHVSNYKSVMKELANKLATRKGGGK